VFDSELAGIEAGRTGTGTPARSRRHGGPPKPAMARLLPPPLDGVASWTGALVPEESWLVAAIAVAELEPLSDFHDRVGQWIQDLADSPGRLLPATWGDRHDEAHERGVAIAPSAWKELKHWANRFAVAVPSPGGS